MSRALTLSRNSFASFEGANGGGGGKLDVSGATNVEPEASLSRGDADAARDCGRDPEDLGGGAEPPLPGIRAFFADDVESTMITSELFSRRWDLVDLLSSSMVTTDGPREAAPFGCAALVKLWSSQQTNSLMDRFLRSCHTQSSRAIGIMNGHSYQCGMRRYFSKYPRLFNTSANSRNGAAWSEGRS